MNDQNLIPTTELTETERRELARKGGIASGEARRRRKQLREDLLAMLDEEVEFKTKDGQSVKATVQAGVARKLIKQASEGNLKAIELMAKLTGEYEDKVKLDADVSSEAKVLLSLGDIEPDDLAKFITDAQKR
jgi:ribosomal protein L9